ncbi:MAG: methyltransferase, partial [Gemmatimonadetes bacterium]|nr:methyltransferase [Gemmatimonadota bacterium]
TAWHFRAESRVRVSAGDWNPRAVRLARRNAESNAVSVEVRRSNLFSAFAGYEGTVDVLVSNPPYIHPEEEDSLPLEVRLGDPSDALFDPDGGTGFHRRIAERGRDFLRPGGFLAMEMGDQQGESVSRVLQDAGYEEVAVLPDLNRRDRIVTGRRPKSTPSS